MVKLSLRAAILLMLVTLMAVWAAPAAARPILPAEDPATLTRRVVELVNEEREKAGLLPLKWNDALAAAATRYAQDLAARNYFAHNSPEGTTPVSRAKDAAYPAYGWGGVYVGENLARGYSTAEAAMRGWMASEGHRNNLLNPKYRETGVGMAVATSGAVVFAQEFGSSPRQLPIFVNRDAESTDSANVTLSITSEDVSDWGSVGKITQMMVSNSSDFAGASWEPYSRAKAWTLGSEPGLKTVYVRLKDEKGNVVASSDHIVLSGRQHRVLMTEAMPQRASSPIARLQLKLGFKSLADQIPEVVGEPTSEEQSDGAGNSIQTTTKGLLVWLKSFNWTAFTDGFWTWINGPFGVQKRTNGQKFDWER